MILEKENDFSSYQEPIAIKQQFPIGMHHNLVGCLLNWKVTTKKTSFKNECYCNAIKINNRKDAISTILFSPDNTELQCYIHVHSAESDNQTICNYVQITVQEIQETLKVIINHESNLNLIGFTCKATSCEGKPKHFATAKLTAGNECYLHCEEEDEWFPCEPLQMEVVSYCM